MKGKKVNSQKSLNAYEGASRVFDRFICIKLYALNVQSDSQKENEMRI